MRWIADWVRCLLGIHRMVYTTTYTDFPGMPGPVHVFTCTRCGRVDFNVDWAGTK